MAEIKRPDALASLTGAALASGDLFLVWDVSAAALVVMTRAELEAGVKLTPLVKTAAYAASPGETVYVDTSAGPVTISAAATPAAGQRPIVLVDIKGTWATNNCTFDPGATPIAVPGASDADSLVCSDDGAVAVIGFDGSKYRIL